MRAQPIGAPKVREVTDVERNGIAHQRHHPNITRVALQKSLRGALLDCLVAHAAMSGAEPRTNARPEELWLHVVNFDHRECIARFNCRRNAC